MALKVLRGIACDIAQARKALQQERVFRSNPWCFSKSVCKSGEDYTSPAFLKYICEDYFIFLFSGKDSRYSSLSEWVDEVLPLDEVLEPFDISPTAPECVEKVLMKCS